jgi:hypothetical protein
MMEDVVFIVHRILEYHQQILLDANSNAQMLLRAATPID